jgi:hypothetical protein
MRESYCASIRFCSVDTHTSLTLWWIIWLFLCVRRLVWFRKGRTACSASCICEETELYRPGSFVKQVGGKREFREFLYTVSGFFRRLDFSHSLVDSDHSLTHAVGKYFSLFPAYKTHWSFCYNFFTKQNRLTFVISGSVISCILYLCSCVKQEVIRRACLDSVFNHCLTHDFVHTPCDLDF